MTTAEYATGTVARVSVLGSRGRRADCAVVLLGDRKVFLPRGNR